MLAQEDLGEMGLTSPSEQVAYLLVERATLLERLEAAERRLESQNFTDGLREVQHQVGYLRSGVVWRYCAVVQIHYLNFQSKCAQPLVPS